MSRKKSREIDLNEKRLSRADLINIVITVVEVLLVISVAYAVTHYGLVRMKVSDENMDPTVKSGQTIVVNRMSYKFRKIKRNEVVALKERNAGHTYYTVERVTGLPGETVQIKDGTVFINGRKLREKYNFRKMPDGGIAEDGIRLEENEYFLLGDNRVNAMDSRNSSIGVVKKSNILGRAFFRVKPFAFVNGINEIDED